MDNLCHSLVGAALAEAGLKRRTAAAYATLVIGANLPDVDIAALPFGNGLGARRGWTHGVLALAVLPFVLAGVMAWWARRRVRRGHPYAEPVIWRELLLLSFVSILTHPALDFMNDYGMRWLMPFSGRWFYGDSLFIVDPWLWLALGTGVLVSRRAERHMMRRDDGAGVHAATRPARVALAIASTYIASMVVTTAFLRDRVAEQLSLDHPSARALMVAPVPLNAFARRVVYDAGDRYALGTVSLSHQRFVAEDEVPKGRLTDDVARAAASRPARTFLGWARFPFQRVERSAAATVMYFGDARYTTIVPAGFGSLTVRLPASISGSPGESPLGTPPAGRR